MSAVKICHMKPTPYFSYLGQIMIRRFFATLIAYIEISRKKVRAFLLHSHLFVTTYFIKKDPAYYPDRQPPGRAVDIPVLSYNKAKIPGPTHYQDSAPQS